jgi:predicted transcriptional regulator
MQTDTSNPMSAAFTVRLDETTLGALDQLAEKTERSRNWLVAKAVEDYVARNVWQVGKIEEGLAAADRGDFASDDEVARVRKKFAIEE